MRMYKWIHTSFRICFKPLSAKCWRFQGTSADFWANSHPSSSNSLAKSCKSVFEQVHIVVYHLDPLVISCHNHLGVSKPILINVGGVNTHKSQLF